MSKKILVLGRSGIQVKARSGECWGEFQGEV
jgi:hypothetical protein